jgi:hypothetical protein
MGREATCRCDWGGTVAEVKALLESGELILRGGLRKRLPFDELKKMKVETDRLCFTVSGEEVQLLLGAAAEKWALAIETPPPSLARKLGITNKTVVQTIGNMDDLGLKSALAEAARISARESDLIVANVDTPEAVEAALREVKTQLAKGVPIWMVYAKGPGHALNEAAIRTTLRSNGMMDTKVASVSAKLTALRFNHSKT